MYKDNPCKNDQKKVGFMAKKESIARSEEGHSMIKVFIHQEDAAVSYLCVPSIPVLLPGNSHGRRSLVGGSPWGRTESDTTEAT